MDTNFTIFIIGSVILFVAIAAADKFLARRSRTARYLRGSIAAKFKAEMKQATKDAIAAIREHRATPLVVPGVTEED